MAIKLVSKGDRNSFQEAYDQAVKAIRAGYTGFYFQTYEEPRAYRVLQRAMQNPYVAYNYERMILWSRASGAWVVKGGTAREYFAKPQRDGSWRVEDEDAQAATKNIAWPIAFAAAPEADKSVIVLCDPGDDLKDPDLERLIRELCWSAGGRDIRNGFDKKNVCLIFLGPKFPPSESLDKEMKAISLRLPGRAEMRSIVDSQASAYERLFAAKEAEARAKALDISELDLPRVNLSEEARDRISLALLGLGESEAESAIAEAAIENNGLSEKCIASVLVTKAEIIKKVEGVTYEEPEPPSDLGGYQGTMAYFRLVSKSMTPKSAAFGRSPAKGIVLVGLPGCGKDWSAKIAAGLMGRPLIKFSFSDVMAAGEGLLGKAEGALAKVLAICDVVKPILHISEFEKALGGQGGERDGGTQKRMLATILDWMNEQEGTFVIATANSLEGLEPEQYRAGRFDRKPMFVDLPNPLERPEIFAVHLRRKGRDPETFDLAALTDATELFSGAEIKGVIEDGLGFAEQRIDGDVLGVEPQDLTTQDILDAIAQTKPLAYGNERLRKIRDWAKGECIFANTPMPAAEAEKREKVLF